MESTLTIVNEVHLSKKLQWKLVLTDFSENLR